MGYLSEFKKNKLPPHVIKKKLLLYVCFGITLISIVLITVFIDPLIQIAKYMSRADYGTLLYEAMNTECEGVHLSTYLFNVTNAKRFQDGLDDKLKVEEVGPFTYKEMRKNELLEIDTKSQIIRYSPKITTKFIPEESIDDPKNVNVTMPNLALLTMASKMGISSFFLQMGFNMLANRFDSKAIVEMNANDYLWGYDEPLIRMGNTILPGLIHFDMLGVLDRLYDNEIRYIYEVSGKHEDKFLIKNVNGTAGLGIWGYNDVNKRSLCNSFTDTYEGIGYPPELTPERNVRVYRNVFCRILDLDFDGIIDTQYGIKGLSYKISDKAFTKNNATECLCNKGICEEGISDLSPCFLGLPVVLSNAHFTGADPKLYERIEGIKPDKERHGSLFVIETKIGMAVETKFSVQVNIKMNDASFNQEASKFSNMVIPVAYFRIEKPKLDEKQIASMTFLHITGPTIVMTMQIIFAFSGIGFLVYSILLFYVSWLNSKGQKNCNKQIKSSVEVPLVK